MITRAIDSKRADPNHLMFDPERAAISLARAGDLDEAAWLIFLATHFGKHLSSGWRRVADVYSGLGSGVWTWKRVSADPKAFRSWLRKNRSRIGGAFGNHRKYETLDPDSANGAAAVIERYIEWVGPERSHGVRLGTLVREGGNHPHTIFDHFYRSMKVSRFGRLAKFEFLALLGRHGLAPISPGSAYLRGATGPLRGARLLFGGRCDSPIAIETLEQWLQEFDTVLGIGMQAIEDLRYAIGKKIQTALCDSAARK